MAKDLEKEFNGQLDVDEYKASEKSGKKYLVGLNKNFPKEFTVGRMNLKFNPGEIIELSADIINHPDFQQQAGYFSIREK